MPGNNGEKLPSGYENASTVRARLDELMRGVWNVRLLEEKLSGDLSYLAPAEPIKGNVSSLTDEHSTEVAWMKAYRERQQEANGLQTMADDARESIKAA